MAITELDMKRKTYERNRRFMPGFSLKQTSKKRNVDMSIQISKEDFIQYEVVKRSKKYKMHTPEARAKTNLSEAQWGKIHKHYDTFLLWISNKESNDLIDRMAERL